ncbi:calcium-binding protein [Sphingobium estronivorans]|uniref:calcium-binding protein n=1 Tax=Sphingobium estronivorans TaxID=1577690 RepID=UPI00123A431D|nr:calcium-binding protein [Sphingobium estronivorans]
MKNFGIVGNPFGQTVITGLSGERHYSREYIDETKTETLMYDFIGVGYTIRSGTNSSVVLKTESQDLITVGSAGMSASSIILGASGAGYSTSSRDDLIGGSGNDFLISTSLQGGNHLNGGAGNDVLVGPGLSGDVLSGGEGEDLLIGRSKGAFYDGGADSDVLSYYHFGSSSPITLNAGFHAVSSRFGTDNFANIERLIGTPGSDIFNLGADHPVIYGGAGSDTFYGNPAADLLGGSGFDTLDLTGTATPLHTADVMLHSIENIRGSDGNDVFSGVNGVIFTGVDSGYTPSIYGGKGDDYVEVRGTINVRGEEGNDTVVIIGGGYGVLDGGDDFDTLDFSRFEASRLIVTLD